MINSQIKDRAVMFLEQKLIEANAETQAEINKGNIIFRDERLYVASAMVVGSTSIFELVKPSDSKKVGLTSFEKGKTDDSKSVGVTGIIARYAPAANSSNVAAQLFSPFTHNIDGTPRVPAELMNADIQVNIGSTVVYEGRLGNLFIQGREANNTTDLFVDLKAPKFISGKQDVQFTIRFAEGSSLTGTAGHNHFLQIELEGAATSKKI